MSALSSFSVDGIVQSRRQGEVTDGKLKEVVKQLCVQLNPVSPGDYFDRLVITSNYAQMVGGTLGEKVSLHVEAIAG